MAKLFGVCLLPATGEFTYDTLPARGAQWSATGGATGTGGLLSFQPINTYLAPGGAATDYSAALDQLQAAHPECQTVSLVVAWFANSTDAAACQIYPSTNFVGGAFETLSAGAWQASNWRCSGLTQGSRGLIPISSVDGAAAYGGTPSDQSVVRCIQDLKSRGFRVVFYPFILMDAPGKPWRGSIGVSSDLSASATASVNDWLGSAQPNQFTRDADNLTVDYSGAPTDWTYRRMILHYANLCVVAGGVDLFLLGSELRGLESVRGPAWTKAGGVDGGGHATWDYPFVAGLTQLAADVRSVFDGAGLTRNLTTWKNLIAYSADWSTWNGVQHPGENGQWPHLDSLFASANVDLVSFDNYLPLSDWTTGGGGLDCLNWEAPAPSSWPPSAATMSGLGLSGQPTIYSAAYLTANIEGGEGFNWFYNDGANDGLGLDPNLTGLMVSRPQGDRLAQARNAFSVDQQLLGRKQYRWWWNNSHQAIYDTGMGWVPQGPTTQWTARMKPIVFAEYGFATVDKCTNQPNVFFSAGSAQSATPYWSIWNSADGGGYLPQRDDLLADMALQATYAYWSAPANNPTSSVGVPTILTPFCCAWNWDARPFPVFPLETSIWSDGGNWAVGNWISGKGPYLPPAAADAPPGAGAYASFPLLIGEGWSVAYSPRFPARTLARVSGRETRVGMMVTPFHDIELNFEFLRGDKAFAELQSLVAFLLAQRGMATPFLFAPPNDLGVVSGATLGIGDGATRAYVIQRPIGGFVENVQALMSAPTVYVDGVPQLASAYSVSILPATVTFDAAPPVGAVLTVDCSAAHLARLRDDQEDLEEFASDLWSLKSLKLETVRA